MGIRLDWEIEAEQDHRQQSAGEDPDARRKRRRGRLRFFLVLFVLLALVGAAVGAVVLRLRQVDWEAEQLMRDSVTAEITTLRLGDYNAFLSMQRSATDDWEQQQEATFARYQTLKQAQRINLTGQILDATVDGSRGRVKIEEIVDGIPYGRIWFYWRYDDGWHHVPPDYTFWGAAETLKTDHVTVYYHDVDADVAHEIALNLAQWLQTGCAALTCGVSPSLVVDIVPDPMMQIGWSPVNSPADVWTLQLPSPYVSGARLDQVFDTGMQVAAATQIADRLVGGVSPLYPADASFLQEAMSRWLVKRFAQVETNSYLISSLAQNYGDAAVGQLLQALQPASDISVISGVTGTSLDVANLDWRDFSTWRLTLESQLSAERDETNFLALYDQNDEAVRNQAYARYNAGEGSDPRSVVSAVNERDANGVPQLRAVVQVGNPPSGEEEVIFRLVDGVWKRAS